MHKVAFSAFLFLFSYLVASPAVLYAAGLEVPSRFISHIVDPSKKQLAFYWRDKEKKPYRSFKNLKSILEKQNKKLVFAMNGGIYQEDYTPLGLFIEKGVVKHRLNSRQDAYGNFYIQPNGVFYIDKAGRGFIIPADKFKHNASIEYATQSGPMLSIEGKINPKLRKGSTNFRIRNGVGLLPDGRLLFAISKGFINFYDFADYFKRKGCLNSLYLDGTVSQVYLASSKRRIPAGSVGIILAETQGIK